MKRALSLLFITAICITGFLSTRGTMPFMPIISSNMEPELQSGSLLMIDPIDPQDVAVGDIIVYSVPNNVREYYDYPPVVAHRVISINSERGLSFRTADANTGEDPFLVSAQNIKGTMGNQIPYLGMPFLIFLSQPGLILTIVILVLLALFLYVSEIKHSWRKLYRRISGLGTNKEKGMNWMIARKLEAAEQKMTATEQVLEKFTTAIADYAQHMASHTSAIRGLRAASYELKRGSAEQNRILMRFIETMEQPRARRETPSWKIEPSIPQPRKPTHEADKPVAKPIHKIPEKPVAESVLEIPEKPVAESVLEIPEKPVVESVHEIPEKPVAESVHEIPEKHKTQFPPGCARNRRATTTQVPSAKPEHRRSRRELIVEALAAEREILKKVRRSAYQV
jgi:signal peptidase I